MADLLFPFAQQPTDFCAMAAFYVVIQCSAREVKMKRKLAAILASGALVMATTAPAFASPSPPTNGGNGAGKSGQCTGPNSERPSSCQSQGGPGNQP